jgi:hypothetical protein
MLLLCEKVRTLMGASKKSDETFDNFADRVMILREASSALGLTLPDRLISSLLMLAVQSDARFTLTVRDLNNAKCEPTLQDVEEALLLA